MINRDSFIVFINLFTATFTSLVRFYEYVFFFESLYFDIFLVQKFFLLIDCEYLDIDFFFFRGSITQNVFSEKFALMSVCLHPLGLFRASNQIWKQTSNF